MWDASLDGQSAIFWASEVEPDAAMLLTAWLRTDGIYTCEQLSKTLCTKREAALAVAGSIA